MSELIAHKFPKYTLEDTLSTGFNNVSMTWDDPVEIGVEKRLQFILQLPDCQFSLYHKISRERWNVERSSERTRRCGRKEQEEKKKDSRPLSKRSSNSFIVDRSSRVHIFMYTRSSKE